MRKGEVIVEEKAILRLFGCYEAALCSLLSLLEIYFLVQNIQENSYARVRLQHPLRLYVPAPISHGFAMQSARLLSIAFDDSNRIFQMSYNPTSAFLVRIFRKASHHFRGSSTCGRCLWYKCLRSHIIRKNKESVSSSSLYFKIKMAANISRLI
jgi:hypothetical protein